MLKSVRIFILPVLNPDGVAMATNEQCDAKEGELNSNLVDLDTNFESKLSNYEVSSQTAKSDMVQTSSLYN